MSDKPQTVEDVLGPRPAASPESILGPRPAEGPMTGDYWDSIFSTGSRGKLLNDMGRGWQDKWGERPLGKGSLIEKGLKEAGILPDYEKGQGGIIRDFNNYIFRNTATALDLAARVPYAAAGALEAQQVSPALHLLGAAGVAGMEAFPAGHMTGLPVPQHPVLRQAAESGTMRERPPGIQPNEAKAVELLSPRGEPSRTEEVIAPAREEPLPPPQANDIHELSRQLDPETFWKYDDLVDTHADLSQQLEALGNARANDPRVQELNAKVAAEQELLQTNMPSGRTQAARRRLAEAQDELDLVLTRDTPEMNAVRLARNTVDADMRELAPGVSDAYQRARDAMPPPPEPTPEPGGAVLPPDDNVVPFSRATPPSNVDEAAAAANPEIYNLLQRRAPIAQDVANKLIEAGRPEEEARADAALWQTHYEARAKRMGGAIGSGIDLYYSEAPNVVAGEGRGRGALNLVTNTIRLMKDADASTFVHESAHSWLEEIQRDAQHEAAPPDLKNDVAAIRDWVGAAEEGPLTRAQHEKFARGFERYLMEGVAPTRRLSSVFAKFKDWLTQIYNTVARLRAPINEQIRGVYDRLLAVTPGETVIAPEREVGLDLGAVHEADLATATPENADVVATNMAAERDALSNMLRSEINNARRRARESKAGPGGGSEAGGERADVPRPVGEGAELVDGGNEDRPEPTAISPSGANFKAESKPPEGGNDAFTEPESRVVGDRGEFKLDNIESPDDVEAALAEDRGLAGNRGPIEPHDILQLADDTGINPHHLDRDALSLAYSKEQIKKLGRLAVAAETDVRDKMVSVAEGGDPLELAMSIARLEMIQGKAVSAASEWGQAGHALRAFKEYTGGRAAEALNQLLKDNTGRSYDELLQLALQGKNLPTPRQVGQAVRGSRVEMTLFGRQVTYAVTNSYLSGLFTHIGYGIGNELRVMLQPVEAGIEGMVGESRVAFGAAPKERVYLEEAGAAIQAIGKGTWDAMRPAWESYKAGKQLPLPGDTVSTNVWNSFSPFGPTTTAILGQPTKIIAGIHQFARVQFYTQALYRYTMREALNEGLVGDALVNRVAQLRNDPPAEIMALARNDADTAIFQRKTQWNSFQAKISNYTDTHAAAKIAFPFVKIGFEMNRESLVRRTPLAMASPEMRADLLMKQGGAAFDEAMGKVIFGTGLFVGGALFFPVTGFGPTDPKQRQEWLLQHQPYSLEVGNLHVPIAGLGYPSKLLQFAADIRETFMYAKPSDMTDFAKHFMKAVARSAFDEGFFRDALQIGEAMNDPGKNAPRLLESIGLGFVPYSSFLSQARSHILDPYVKDPETGFEPHAIFDQLRARMPITSWAIPNKMDAFGQLLPSRGFNMNRYANDPTARWLDSIQTGPGTIPRKIWGVQLTPEQHEEYARLSGRLTKQFLDNAFASGVPNMPRGMQLRIINDNVGTAREMARAKIAAESFGTSNDIYAGSNALKLKALE